MAAINKFPNKIFMICCETHRHIYSDGNFSLPFPECPDCLKLGLETTKSNMVAKEPVIDQTQKLLPDSPTVIPFFLSPAVIYYD
jgi:hypothetical protein